MGIVDPHRAPLAERNERQPLPVTGDEVQSRLDGLEQLVVGRAAAPENTDTPATCMCAESRSRCRNELSSPVSRSLFATAGMVVTGGSIRLR